MAKVSELPAPNGGLNLGANVGDLVSLFLGKDSTQNTEQSGTTDGASTENTTTVQSSGMTPEAIQAAFTQALQATGGLASVASGQAGTGLYNSTTNQLMQNDLVSRVAGQVLSGNKYAINSTTGAKTANTSTAQNTAQQASQKAQIDPTKAALGLGALSAIPKEWKDAIMDKLGLGSSAAKPATTTAPSGGSGSGAKPPTIASNSGSSSSANKDNNANAADGPTEKDVQDVLDKEGTNKDSESAIDQVGASEVGSGAISEGQSPSTDIGNGGADLGDFGDFGSFIDYSDQNDYSMDMGDDSGGGDYESTDQSTDSSAGSSYEDYDYDSYDAADPGDDEGYASGGLVDPNRPEMAVSSNLDFSQHNQFALEAVRAILGQAHQAGYADGGMVGRAVSGKSMSRVRPGYADGGLVARRQAAMDAAEGAAVNGDNSNDAYQKTLASGSDQQAAPAQQSASAPKRSSGTPLILQAIKKSLGFKNGGLVMRFADGGLVDLTNLGLQISARAGGSNSAGPVGLSAVNDPQDEETAEDIVAQVTGKDETGTSASNSVASKAVQSSRASANAANKPRTAGSPPNKVPDFPGVKSPSPSPTPAPIGPGIGGDSADTASKVADVGTIVGGILNGAPDVGTIGGSNGTSDSGESAPDISGEGTPYEDPTDTITQSGKANADEAVANGQVLTSYFTKGGGVNGPGTKTSDSIDAKLSDGEFVVNAEATARYRPFLEMINNSIKAR